MTSTMVPPKPTHYNGSLPPVGAWALKAACHGLSGWERGYDDFFGEEPSDVAKEACASCSVREDCLDYAMTYGPYGYWGGTTYTERRKLRPQRRATALPIVPSPTLATCPGCRSQRSMPLGGGHRECADCGARWPA